MSSTRFNDVAAWVKRLTVHQHPSEVHGVISGWLCAGSRWDPDNRHAALCEWLNEDVPPTDMAIVDSLWEEAAAGLADQEMGFRLLLPDDEASTSARAEAISAWCGGFLSGFGMTGRFQQGELSDDLQEVLSDIGRISSFGEDVPDDDENEADLIEIGEYVRMSALLVFTECAGKETH